MTLAAGTRLGVYEVVALIGAGGMGEVYRARDPRLNRDVAIKVLPAGFSADPDRLRRFEQEARAAAALNHPNILAVFDIGDAPNPDRSNTKSPIPKPDKIQYVVSELLDGETLRERLNGGALPVRKAVEYAAQIAHGLAAAHEKGIVHRDLKPENIFVTSDGRAKILDFGLAKLTETEPTSAAMSALPTTPPFDLAQGRPNTEAGIVLGTIGYMAPEQVRALAADHRADIFAFGAVLYEMLSGQRAFRGETTADTMTAILKEDPPDLPGAERHIPPALARIVDRCLEKNPAARFQSTRDLAFALEGLSSHSETITAVTSTRPAIRLDRVAWAIAGLMGLTAAVAVAALYLRAPAGESGSVRFTVVPPTDTVFPRGGAASPHLSVSPDGRRVAFIAGRRGYPASLWVRELDVVEARVLAGTVGAILPFWSPDGRFVGFFADGKLKKVDTSGGSAQIICDAPNGEGGSWNTDDQIIFGTTSGGLFQISASGGQPAELTKLDGGRKETSHRHPEFLPDGRRFIYLAFPSNTIYGGALDSADAQPLLMSDARAVYARPGYLVFVRQGVLMAQAFDAETLKTAGQPFAVAQPVGYAVQTGRASFSVSEAGVLTYSAGVGQPVSLIAWFDRTGRPLEGANSEARAYQNVSLSPDEQQIAVAAAGDIWLVDVRRGVSSRFTTEVGIEGNPVWSPDSRRLIFNSDRRGQPDLFEKSLSGGEETLLYSSDEADYPEDWSSDGRFIAYLNLGGPRLWILPTFGDRKPFLFLETRFVKDEPHFSPDGRWLAYYSAESGRPEVYVEPFPGPGERVRVSTDGGSQPRWRKDSAELFYLSLDGKMMAVALKSGSTLEPSAPVVLFQTPITEMVPNTDQYDVTSDGQRFVILSPVDDDAPQSPITVVVNWTAGLKK